MNIVSALQSKVLVCIFSSVIALPVSAAAELEIHGSNTVGDRLAPALIAGFLAHRGASKIRIETSGVENEKNIYASVQDKPFVAKVAAHGTSTGFAGLSDKTADIAAASRPAKAGEIELLAPHADLRHRSSEHIIAIDGLAVLVHPANPINTLDKETVARIFAGQISNWQQLGGPDRAIVVLARDERSGTWDTFKSLVLGKTYKLSPAAARFESNDRLSDEVSQNPAAIGFTGLASVRSSKALAIAEGDSRALAPSPLNVATEDYPLSRRLYFYSRGDNAQALTREFLKFSQGPEGQAIVQQNGYVSQNIQVIPKEAAAGIPESFQRLTQDFRRLSVNFRFAEGRTKLDNKAHRDLERLARFISERNLSGRDLLLIGFADPQGDELRAQMISELRAISVRRALRTEQNLSVDAHTGYGQYMPVGEAESGRDAGRNGRVEVWIRNSDNLSALAF